ncbi:type II secretion system protein [Candidatus Poribacteria bacterium]|nr:type II secretion system protein [Candidatus Poribacteria bacterium]
MNWATTTYCIVVARFIELNLIMKSKENGLTLIELLMTIFIVAMLSAIVLPRTTILTSANLRSFSRKFSGEIKYYFNQSILRKVYYKIEIDFTERNSYSVYSYKEGEWVEEKGKVFLPDGVFFQDLIASKDKIPVTTGIGEIRFSSLGYMDGVTIHLTDGKETSYTIIVNSLSGKVKIFNNYVKKEGY